MIFLLRLLREKKPGDSFHSGKGFKAFETGHAILAACCVCAWGIFCTILLMWWLCRGANNARKDRGLLLALQRLCMKKLKAKIMLTVEIKNHTSLSVAAAWDSPCTGERPTSNKHVCKHVCKHQAELPSFLPIPTGGAAVSTYGLRWGESKAPPTDAAV